MENFWVEAPVVGRLRGLDIVLDLASGVVCFPSFERNCSIVVDRHHTGLVSCDDCYILFDPSSCFLLPRVPAK
jgi:hypothetical protein